LAFRVEVGHQFFEPIPVLANFFFEFVPLLTLGLRVFCHYVFQALQALFQFLLLRPGLGTFHPGFMELAALHLVVFPE